MENRPLPTSHRQAPRPVGRAGLGGCDPAGGDASPSLPRLPAKRLFQGTRTQRFWWWWAVVVEAAEGNPQSTYLQARGDEQDSARPDPTAAPGKSNCSCS